MKYPNLAEVYRWHPYSDATFANHAEVTIRLFNEVIYGDEVLTFKEMYKIARLIEMPVSALLCPKLIMLKKDNFKHRTMTDKVKNALNVMNEHLAGGDEAIKEYINHNHYDIMCEDYLNDFFNNKVTYGRYIAIKEHISSLFLRISFIKSKSSARNY